MDVKRKEAKPMVIHTKEKPKFHVRGVRSSKISGGTKTGKVVKSKSSHVVSAIKVKAYGRGIKAKAASEKQVAFQKEERASHEDIRKAVRKEDAACVQRGKADFCQKRKKDRERTAGKKNDTLSPIASVGEKMSLDQMEGENQVYESFMTARSLSRPLECAADAERQLYRRQAAKKAERIKKVQEGGKIGKKAVRGSAVKATKETAKENAKTTAKVTAKAAGAAVGGVPIGAAAGEVVGRELDRQDMKNSTRNRMIRLFVSKLKQEKNQDSIGKTLKDIAMMRFFMLLKHMVRYVGLILFGLLALVALVSLPIIIVIAVIYNSPFAIFFPSISSAETIQQILSAYTAEFDEEVNRELAEHSGYDTSEKIYIDFEGAHTPDNCCDILAVYMVKYGNGDAAADMTDKAKENLKKVFDDMCSYSVSSRTDTESDEEGNAITTTVKEVNVELKTCRDMISVYGFDMEEQEILAELMKTEYLVMMGYTGGGGDPGEAISPKQYQAIVDAVSDANGKKVVEYVLAKVGFPYSQVYRDSGNYYDCSSLAYYAWQSAGVCIMYEGESTAAAEGKFCYDNNYLVNYEEMQPGDLIFYSYSRNGRFFNITHVAVYVGDGKVVEAANERLGVVYRPVQGRASIVFIGRPR